MQLRNHANVALATCIRLKASSSSERRSSARNNQANLRQGTETRIVEGRNCGSWSIFTITRNWVDFKRDSPHCDVINSDAFGAATSVVQPRVSSTLSRPFGSVVISPPFSCFSLGFPSLFPVSFFLERFPSRRARSLDTETNFISNFVVDTHERISNFRFESDARYRTVRFLAKRSRRSDTFETYERSRTFVTERYEIFAIPQIVNVYETVRIPSPGPIGNTANDVQRSGSSGSRFNG